MHGPDYLTGPKGQEAGQEDGCGVRLSKVTLMLMAGCT